MKWKNKIITNCLKTITGFRIFLDKNFPISALLVFGFFVTIFLLIYMKLPVLSSTDDHYFHFRFAERFIHNGFLNSFNNFKTLSFTKIALGEHFMYYNFLFYIVLIPFTFITPLYLGIKLFAIFSVSLIGVIFYFFFTKMNVKYSFWWTLGFFSLIGLSSLWRLFLSRPFVLSPLIIILLILSIYKKKYFWIFFLSFITLFWHTATFLVPLGVILVYFFCNFFYYRKYLWKELLLVFLGTISSVFVAFLINHGFFISLRDNLFSVLDSVLHLTGDSVNIAEGNEVYPKNFFDLLNQNIFLCTTFFFASVIYVFSFLKEIKQAVNIENSEKSKKVVAMTLFILSTVFIIAINFISNRFSDFFIFFAWILIVLVLSNVFSHIEFSKINLKKNVGYAVFICLIYLFFNNSLQLNDMFASGGSRPDSFSQIGSYLSKNLKKNDIVFNVMWNWFPQLYYYAPDQNYVIGLEPKLTYLYNPKIYWLWKNLSNGFVCETEECPINESLRNGSFKKKDLFKRWSKTEGDKIALTITEIFNSHYVVTSRDYFYLNSVLDNNDNFQKVVNDSNNGLFVYKIVD